MLQCLALDRTQHNFMSDPGKGLNSEDLIQSPGGFQQPKFLTL